MILIADSGSTHTLWSWKDHLHQVYSVSTQGLNPYFHNLTSIVKVIQEELKPQLKEVEITEIFFYGSGCSNEEQKDLIRQGLQLTFEDIKYTVDHDLLAAARGLCMREPGIACILGTGSNSCSYNGTKIVEGTASLGYILGDEGAGSYIGKHLLKLYFDKELDEILVRKLEMEFTDLTLSNALKHIYKGSQPNKYLASFAKFVCEHCEFKQAKDLLQQAFQAFIDKHLKKYSEVYKLPVHFVGSVAYYNRSILSEVLEKNGMKLGTIVPTIQERLLAYHEG